MSVIGAGSGCSLRAAIEAAGTTSAAVELAEEAVVAAVRHLERFDRRRRFGPWLGAIVAKRAIDWSRARAARRESGSEPPDFAGPPDRPHAPYSEEVLAALGTLSPE